jgi:hypothetical protein
MGSAVLSVYLRVEACFKLEQACALLSKQLHSHAPPPRVHPQVFTITVPSEQESAARQLVLAMSPNARLTYSVGGTLKFELPTSEVRLIGWLVAVNSTQEVPALLQFRRSCYLYTARLGFYRNVDRILEDTGQPVCSATCLPWGHGVCVRGCTTADTVVVFAMRVACRCP